MAPMMMLSSAVLLLALQSTAAFLVGNTPKPMLMQRQLKEKHERPLAASRGTAPGLRPLPVCMRAVPTSGEEGGVSRRESIERALLGVAGGFALATGFSAEAIAATDKYTKVSKAIDKMVTQSPDKGPTLVRLAWHASGTYDKIARDGGSFGGTIRFKEELEHGANAGLLTAVEWLEPIKKANPSVSYGDLYTLAGVQAIKTMKGPDIKWRAGRKDAMDASSVTPDGRLPAADKGNPKATAKGLRDIFYRMGFNDQEIVALSGAHALGRCHANASGYEGPWTPNPTNFSNLYFVLLRNLKWTPRKWEGPFQYQDPTGELMMLPSDLVLIEDKEFKKYVDLYAENNAKFFEDFSAAFTKLQELGCAGLVDVPV